MNKQELLKQADTNFQRGNRELAKKYLAEVLSAYPKEESAWILLAKVVEEKERKIECYECALKINPNNSEVKLTLDRLKRPQQPQAIDRQVQKFFTTTVRGISIAVVILLIFGTTTFAIALNNPNSAMAKLIIHATATPFTQKIANNVAPQTRSEVSAKYPQYAPLVDSLIGFAVNNADSGMKGAPERPGAEIIPSNIIGKEAGKVLENSMPKPGSLTTVTLSEQQLTSWLSMEMQNSPDLPFSDVQVYLRDGKIQIWGTVKGVSNTTSALIVGNLGMDTDKNPVLGIDSMQIGQQVIPGILVSQTESWLNQLLLDAINEQVPGLKIMNINISSGSITVSGMR